MPGGRLHFSITYGLPPGMSSRVGRTLVRSTPRGYMTLDPQSYFLSLWDRGLTVVTAKRSSAPCRVMLGWRIVPRTNRDCYRQQADSGTRGRHGTSGRRVPRSHTYSFLLRVELFFRGARTCWLSRPARILVPAFHHRSTHALLPVVFLEASPERRTILASGPQGRGEG